jgi:uncharacterized membrane-anchored protein YhcB (DUF1043 family)
MAVDPVVPLWLLVVGTLLAGVIAGILYERFAGTAAKRAAKFESDLVQARSELMHYREETARHFGKSAELLGRMASDYREFLHHFVNGAEELCGSTMKEISVSTLSRPLLDTTGAAPPPPPVDPTIDSEPLAEDLPHELHGLAGSEAQPGADRPR